MPRPQSGIYYGLGRPKSTRGKKRTTPSKKSKLKTLASALIIGHPLTRLIKRATPDRIVAMELSRRKGKRHKATISKRRQNKR